MKYYIIAGEASGDLHGSNLIKAIRKQDSNAQIRAWGGDRMQSEGADLVKHYRDLAFMGFVEVVMNLRTILGNLKFCKADIDKYSPDVLVLIDYPGFNMRIAEYAKQKGIKVVYYISPQIWAWKQNRVHKLKRDVDRMLCILPFEKDFYARFDMEVDFVGHPLIDEIDGRPEVDINDRKKQLGLDTNKQLIVLLPGSRKQEIKAMLPIMVKAAKQFKDLEIAIAAAPSQEISFYTSIVSSNEIKVIPSKTYDLLEVAQAALVTSGTATLETALFKVPEVVCYKGNWMSYMIARQLVKVPYISLVNLIADREMVTELIQGEMNVKRLTTELRKCLDETRRRKFTADYEELITKLGGTGASEAAAKIIVHEAQV